MITLGKYILTAMVAMLPVLSHAGSSSATGTLSNLNIAERWGQTVMTNNPTFSFRRTGSSVWYYVSVSEVGIEKYEKMFSLVLMAIDKNRSVYFEFDVVNSRNEVDSFSL